jgi:hypothetical protein
MSGTSVTYLAASSKMQELFLLHTSNTFYPVYAYIPDNPVRYLFVMLEGMNCICGVYFKFISENIVTACSDIFSPHCVGNVIFHGKHFAPVT